MDHNRTTRSFSTTTTTMVLSLICAMNSRELICKQMGTRLMHVYQCVYEYIRGHEFMYGSAHWFRIVKINQMCALLTLLAYIRIYFYRQECSCGGGGVDVRVVRPPREREPKEWRYEYLK
jgi:hypothetical protein